MHKCTFNELAIPPISMRYPSKCLRKTISIRAIVQGENDCIPFRTRLYEDMIYGVESEAAVPETASTTACANTTVDSNSCTSVIADRKVLYKLNSLDNSGLVLDVDHESSSKKQVQANASCGEDGCRHDLDIRYMNGNVPNY